MPTPFHDNAEKANLVMHLRHLGYTISQETDPHGWHMAEHAFGPPICFLVGPDLIRMHAEYPAGTHGAEARVELLKMVNFLNASQWLVRCTAIMASEGGESDATVRLQANLPLGLPQRELGECIFAWIRESAYVERAVDRHRWHNMHGMLDQGRTEEPTS